MRAPHALRHPRRVWSSIHQLTGISGRPLAVLAAVSFIRGLLEAGVLVIVARVAVAIADSGDAVTFGVGLLGTVQLTIRTALLAGMTMTVLMVAAHLVVGHLTARITTSAALAARRRLMQSFMAADWPTQSQERRGRLQEVLTTYAQRAANGARHLGLVLSLSCNLLALLLASVLLNPVAAVALLGVIIALTAVFRPLSRLTRRRAHVARDDSAEFAGQVAEVVDVAMEVNTLGVTGPVLDRLDGGAEAAARSAYGVQLLQAVVPGLYQALAMSITLIGLGVVRAAEIGNAGGIAALVLLLIRAVTYGQRLQGSINQLNEVRPYLAGLVAEDRRYRAARVERGGQALPTVRHLRLEEVSYAYDGGAQALWSVSAQIGQGETIGVVGPSGSGKSTFVQIILRLLGPDDGRYLVNDVPAGEYAPEDWASRVALVPQRARLLGATVAENIRFFRRGISDDAIIAAARAAHIHDEVTGWDGGYEAEIGGVGDAVSGGQAQRICLARALVAGPELLVLDEPTSALDVRSEELVQQTLSELGPSVTLVVIAHRMSTLRRCNRIMVFEGGALRAFDTPEVLRRDEPFYREAIELSALG